MFAFEIITIASNVIDPCPSDEILTATFEEKKSDLKELSDLIRKEPWSSNASETGREIVRQKSDMIISMDPWQVKESEETTSLVLSKEKEKQFDKLMDSVGARAVIKDMEGVVKFEYWARAIPYMKLRKFIIHNPSPYQTDDFSTEFQSGSFDNSKSTLSPVQKLYFPDSFYSFKNLNDGWGIEFGIM